MKKMRHELKVGDRVMSQWPSVCPVTTKERLRAVMVNALLGKAAPPCSDKVDSYGNSTVEIPVYIMGSANCKHCVAGGKGGVWQSVWASVACSADFRMIVHRDRKK